MKRRARAHGGKRRRARVEPRCGKRRYRDKREAVEAIRRVYQHKDGPVFPHRIYPCPRCNGWHLASTEG